MSKIKIKKLEGYLMSINSIQANEKGQIKTSLTISPWSSQRGHHNLEDIEFNGIVNESSLYHKVKYTLLYIPKNTEGQGEIQIISQLIEDETPLGGGLIEDQGNILEKESLVLKVLKKIPKKTYIYINGGWENFWSE